MDAPPICPQGSGGVCPLLDGHLIDLVYEGLEERTWRSSENGELACRSSLLTNVQPSPCSCPSA